jgi:hypothetical protein
LCILVQDLAVFGVKEFPAQMNATEKGRSSRPSGLCGPIFTGMSLICASCGCEMSYPAGGEIPLVVNGISSRPPVAGIVRVMARQDRYALASPPKGSDAWHSPSRLTRENR